MRARHEIKEIQKHHHCYKLQSIQKSIHTRSDLLRARREIVEKGKAAIVTNCKAFSSHFKVKSLGQIFSIFCVRRKIIKKERTLLLQTTKYSTVLSK